ncbi:flowering time control protein FCA-like [Magnolia sinica]|uniref:flowering time control protein FCA-like n=1 Tax=Magnolia sinica TaxID=86752 RepID=UPI0026590A31|nr:flowering time control protein FCA-like [Magnolia sinica]
MNSPIEEEQLNYRDLSCSPGTNIFVSYYALYSPSPVSVTDALQQDPKTLPSIAEVSSSREAGISVLEVRMTIKALVSPRSVEVNQDTSDIPLAINRVVVEQVHIERMAVVRPASLQPVARSLKFPSNPVDMATPTTLDLSFGARELSFNIATTVVDIPESSEIGASTSQIIPQSTPKDVISKHDTGNPLIFSSRSSGGGKKSSLFNCYLERTLVGVGKAAAKLAKASAFAFLHRGVKSLSEKVTTNMHDGPRRKTTSTSTSTSYFSSSLLVPPPRDCTTPSKAGMERNRGDYHRYNNPEPYRSSRTPHPPPPSRSSSSSDSRPPPFSNHHHHHHSRYSNNSRSSGFSDGLPPFNDSQNQPLGGGAGFRPTGGGYGGPGGQMGSVSGHKRGASGFPVSDRGGSPDKIDGGNFAKLFIGSVPRTATEEDIRPFFEEHGNVIEVALIKDKRTGQQQGCCFVKYATTEEADRAIRALHNQITLRGGSGPIQVRYADGERERLGNFASAVEYKLFVGSMNRQATEMEVEEIFSPYGCVEDVYIMRDDLKQSRGCGFVKFSRREMAEAAINALNGTYVMRGCDQPLTVRFADPKRPRAGESRFGPAFGGPGLGPLSQAPSGVRPMSNLGESIGEFNPSNAWDPMSPQNMGPSSKISNHSFGGHLAARDVGAISSSAVGSLGALGGPRNGSLPDLPVTPSSTPQQSFNPSIAQIPSFSSKISPLQKPLESPQDMPSSLQLHPLRTYASFSQAQTSQPSIQQLGQLQFPLSVGQHSFSQALPSQQLFGLSRQSSVSQPLVQQSASAAGLQTPLSLQHQGVTATTAVATSNQQQLPAGSIQQPLPKPMQQSPSQLPQVLAQHQTQVLQSSFQSSQQAFSHLQQQLNLMQPNIQSLSLQQTSQAGKPQSPWTGITAQTAISSQATAPSVIVPSAMSAAPATTLGALALPTLTCHWTEHTSPEGYKYYYNSVTTESKWEKPEELTLFEQQQQQQKLYQQKLAVPQPQSESHTQIQSAQHISQTQQVEPQLRQQQLIQLQQQSLSSSYGRSGVTGEPNVREVGYAQLQATNSSLIDTARFQQGLQSAQEWMWKNKPAGT